MSLIDDLNPPCDHNKYADDLTSYFMIQINDVELQNSTAHKATVTRIHNNTLQIAADLTSKFSSVQFSFISHSLSQRR